MFSAIFRARCLMLFAVGGTLVSGFAAGCGVRVPVHATPRVEGPAGANTIVDPSTIRPGISRREEILRDWGWCEAHVDSDRLFLGRVNRSTTRGVNVMVVPIPVPYAGSSRDWEIQNLFIEFDVKGVVSKAYFVSD